MAKKRKYAPKPLSEQMHNAALDARLVHVEGFVRLAVADLQNIVRQLNLLGNILQATVNVLGTGAVDEEMKRLASPEPGPAPKSEEQKAAEAGAY